MGFSIAIVESLDRPGLLRDLATAFAKNGLNIIFSDTVFKNGHVILLFLFNGDPSLASALEMELKGVVGVRDVEVHTEWDNVLPKLTEFVMASKGLFMKLTKVLAPGDVAEVVRALDPRVASHLLALVPGAEEVLRYLPSETLARIIEYMSPRDVVQLVKALPVEKLVDVLQQLEPSLSKSIMNKLSPEIKEQVTRLLRYSPETVGGIMRIRVARVKVGSRVRDAVEVAREYDTDTVYVVDDEGRLLGLVDVVGLDKLGEVVDMYVTKPPLVLVPGMDRELAARHFIRYGLTAAPVVDEKGKLIGEVRASDIIDVIVREATEDLLKLEAIQPFTTYLGTKVIDLFRKRTVSLLFIFLVESITASIIKGFESVIEAVAVAVAFMPLIAHMTGSVGSQATTIMTRAIALGEVVWGSVARVMWREFLVSFLIGLSMASLGMAFSFAISLSPRIAFAVALALLVVIVWINALGTLLPLLAARLKIDPAVISGPLITTLGDIVGITFYFLTISITLH